MFSYSFFPNTKWLHIIYIISHLAFLTKRSLLYCLRIKEIPHLIYCDCGVSSQGHSCVVLHRAHGSRAQNWGHLRNWLEPYCNCCQKTPDPYRQLPDAKLGKMPTLGTHPIAPNHHFNATLLASSFVLEAIKIGCYLLVCFGGSWPTVF